MQACAFVDDPTLAQSPKAGASETTTVPVLRETVHICIGGVSAVIYKDEIEELLYKEIFQTLRCC